LYNFESSFERESFSGELETLDERIKVTNENLKNLDKKLGEVQKKRKKSQAELEAYRLREREIADKIEEDAKELEKMASKQTVLQVRQT
jgi:structural maintenance of chromosome 3 (chondroitin sulfate proteoglycan 6)